MQSTNMHSCAGAMQQENVPLHLKQGTQTGDVSMTGPRLQSPATAGPAGATAAAVGASSERADGAAAMQLDDDQAGPIVDAAAQKALPAALTALFKKYSVVNIQNIR